jgi:hypothetical protein
MRVFEHLKEEYAKLLQKNCQLKTNKENMKIAEKIFPLFEKF